MPPTLSCKLIISCALGTLFTVHFTRLHQIYRSLQQQKREKLEPHHWTSTTTCPERFTKVPI